MLEVSFGVARKTSGLESLSTEQLEQLHQVAIEANTEMEFVDMLRRHIDKRRKETN